VLFLNSYLLSQVAGYAKPNNVPSTPDGFLGASSITAVGFSLVPLITQSAEFQELSRGIHFHIEPHSSFGYTWGVGISSTERIVLFSPDDFAYIVSEVNIGSKQIESMYFVNDTEVGTYFDLSADWGGYYAQYCTGTFFGFCNGQACCLNKVYGNVQVPDGTFAPPNPPGAVNACCAFAEWTGVQSGTGSSACCLTQGGVQWSGVNYPPLPDANGLGFTLFVEYVPSPSNLGTGPVYLAPPSWMNGVAGQTITMTTEVFQNCGSGGLTNDWWQFWQMGSSSTAQEIICSNLSDNYGLYILETPYNPSRCSTANGGYPPGLCVLPRYTYGGGNSIGFTGNICYNLDCRNINSNADPLIQDSIAHNSQDTSTSNIPGGGNSWTETWLSSN